MKDYQKSNGYPESYEGKSVCCTCVHYIQHYRCNERTRRFEAVACGHCVFPRMKTRAPDMVCDNWREGAEEE